LQLRLSGDEKKRLTKRYTENGEAYQLYVMGRYFRRTRSEKGFQKSVEFFEQAIKKDPNYAPAYAGLAMTYAFLGGTGLLPPKEALQKEEWAALKALEIDNDLAEAHTAMAALVRKRDLNWSASEEEFKLALELNPNSVDAHQNYATSLAAWGRFDEAMLHLKRAEEIDPLSPITKAEIGNLFYFSRQYDRAIDQFQQIIETDPNFAPAHNRLQRAYLAKGMYEEAISEQKKAIASDQPEGRWFRTADLGNAYAVAGKRAEAEQVLDKLKELAKQRYVSPNAFAVIYMGLGDKDQAFEWLEKTFEARPDNLYFLKVSPQYDGLRSDPRFTDLLRRMKLA
jgi:serine/threonine-protein kinase